MSRRVPQGIDVKTPNTARIYDYLLGGKDNFAADREVADKILKVLPEVRAGVVQNRAFLANVVHYLVKEAGILQFLDVGAGLPTQRNVHEVAQDASPDARVVYIDNDPVVCVHGRALLASSPNVAMVESDLRRPEEACDLAVRTGLIDCSQPVAVLMVGVLHYMEDPYDHVAKFRELMPPGSYLAISHLTDNGNRRTDIARMVEYHKATGTVLVPRSIAELERFFGDFERLDQSLFTPRSTANRFAFMGWGGVGRKPG